MICNVVILFVTCSIICVWVLVIFHLIHELALLYFVF